MMRSRTHYQAFAAGAMLGVLILSSPAGADEKFSDTTCPSTVSSVVTFTAVAGAQPLDSAALLNAAVAAGDNYEVCAERQRSDQRLEPQAHYAQYRAAQYYIVAARLEIQLGAFDLAHKYLNIARQEATDVIGWQPVVGSQRSRGNAATHSVWTDKSKSILIAVDDAAKRFPAPETQPAPVATP